MPATLLWALTDALITRCQADEGLTELGVDIVGGNPWGGHLDANISLAIAADTDDEEGLVEVATSSQQWRGLGAKTRDEELAIQCQITIRDGATDYTIVRDTAQAVLERVAAILRASLSLDIAQVLWTHITAVALRQVQTDRGVAAIIPFTVSARCRIVTGI